MNSHNFLDVMHQEVNIDLNNTSAEVPRRARRITVQLKVNSSITAA